MICKLNFNKVVKNDPDIHMMLKKKQKTSMVIFEVLVILFIILKVSTKWTKIKHLSCFSFTKLYIKVTK